MCNVFPFHVAHRSISRRKLSSRVCPCPLSTLARRRATYMVCRGADRAGDRLAAQQSHTTSPTCRRLSPDFALFPAGYRDSFRLTGVSHQKARSRPRQSYRPLAPTRWGDGFIKSPIGHTSADEFARRLRATARSQRRRVHLHESSLKLEKAPRRFRPCHRLWPVRLAPANPQQPREARRFPVLN